MPDLAAAVRHDARARHFTLELPEGLAELAYAMPDARTLDLAHTWVPRDARGRGAADALVHAAVEHARQEALQLVAGCGFVRRWLARHPEAADVFVSPAVGGAA